MAMSTCEELLRRRADRSRPLSLRLKQTNSVGNRGDERAVLKANASTARVMLAWERVAGWARVSCRCGVRRRFRGNSLERLPFIAVTDEAGAVESYLYRITGHFKRGLRSRLNKPATPAQDGHLRAGYRCETELRPASPAQPHRAW